VVDSRIAAASRCAASNAFEHADGGASVQLRRAAPAVPRTSYCQPPSPVLNLRARSRSLKHGGVGFVSTAFVVARESATFAVSNGAASGRRWWIIRGVHRAALIVFAAVFGALIGSFLNVVIWRLPRHESIVTPRSHCPACGTVLRARELIPVASWLALRGRCATCGKPISVRYPVVELLCAGVAVGLTWWLA